MPNRANGHYFSLAWLLTNRKNIFANRVVKSPGLLGEGRSMVKYTKLTWRTRSNTWMVAEPWQQKTVRPGGVMVYRCSRSEAEEDGLEASTDRVG